MIILQVAVEREVGTAKKKQKQKQKPYVAGLEALDTKVSMVVASTVVWLVLSALFRPLYGVGWLLWGRLLVVGAGVGASRGVPAFKRARGRPPGGPKD